MTSSALPPAVLERKEQIEKQVIQTQKGPQSLRERMARLTIPGVSVAIINDYQLEWAGERLAHRSSTNTYTGCSGNVRKPWTRKDG